MHRDFQSKLQALRSQLLPDLRGRREDLLSMARGVEGRIAEVRQRCAEAEREAREEFEALKSHLGTVEHAKLAVLGSMRDKRLKLAEEIDGLNQRVRSAESALPETMATFVREYPDIRAAAETLWSRSLSLAQVDVSLDDIPFETRAKTESLRKFAVIDRIHRAKDLCLWRLEQQRRQLMQELQDAAVWLRHFESVLGRYTEELAYTCYFCAEHFSASAANSRCPFNQGVSPRTGRAMAADPHVPPHLWGASVHFWVPGGTDKTFEPMSHADLHPMSHADWHPPWAPPSRHSTPPRGLPWHDMQKPPPQVSEAAAMRASRQRAAEAEAEMATSAQLRRVAQAVEQHGLDVRSAFRAFDANGDGLLSPQEFRHALAQLRVGLSDEQAGLLVSRLDTNSDGMVSYEDFLTQLFRSARDPAVAQVGPAFVEHFAAHESDTRVLWQRVAREFEGRGWTPIQVFSLFDKNGDGVISRSEVLEAFRLVRPAINDGDVERLMKDICAGQDDSISIRELAGRLQ